MCGPLCVGSVRERSRVHVGPPMCVDRGVCLCDGLGVHVRSHMCSGVLRGGGIPVCHGVKGPLCVDIGVCARVSVCLWSPLAMRGGYAQSTLFLQSPEHV